MPGNPHSYYSVAAIIRYTAGDSDTESTVSTDASDTPEDDRDVPLIQARRDSNNDASMPSNKMKYDYLHDEPWPTLHVGMHQGPLLRQILQNLESQRSDLLFKLVHAKTTLMLVREKTDVCIKLSL